MPRHHPRTILNCILLAAALCAHLGIVYTIARQPLDVNNQDQPVRSIIWPLYNDTVHRRGPGADLFAVYHAGHALAQRLSPYGSVESPQRTPYFYPFRYLPIVGQSLGRFLALFSPRVAYWLWVALLEVFLGLIVIALRGRFHDWRLRCFSACLLLLSSPYFLELHLGQFTFLTLVLLSLGLLIQEHPRGRLVGLRAKLLGALAYSGALLLKFFPIVTGAALIRHRRYLLGLGLAILMLALAIPYFVTHPNDLNIFYAKNLANQAGGMDSGNYGLVYLVYLLVHDLKAGWMIEHWMELTSWWRLGTLGLTALVVFLSREDRVILGTGALIFAHFVGYSQVWEHHMSGAIVVGLLMLMSLSTRDEQHGRSIVPALLILSLLLLALPTPFALLDQAKDPSIWDPAANWPAYARYLLVLPKVIPTVAIYLGALVLLCRAGLALPGLSGSTGTHQP